jgi:hypothetical protein
MIATIRYEKSSCLRIFHGVLGGIGATQVFYASARKKA